MPCVGFERTTPVFEQAKKVHAPDRAPTVIGQSDTSCLVLSLVCMYAIVLFPCFALTCFIIGIQFLSKHINKELDRIEYIIIIVSVSGFICFSSTAYL
jgi:hypothetical protein